ncbi:MAG: GNAT family N-acetyltransferase [Phycisphaeraceae bacterium]
MHPTVNDMRRTDEQTQLRIRPASLRDGPVIVAVIRQALPPVGNSFSPVLTSDAQRYAADRQLGRTFYVAEIDGQIVGMVAVRVLDHRTGEIARLAVLPEYRRRGIGSALMVYALAWGREQELMRMELMMPAAQGALRQWFEGFGFATTTTHELPGGLCPISWMSRTLRPVTVRNAGRGRDHLSDPAELCGVGSADAPGAGAASTG